MKNIFKKSSTIKTIYYLLPLLFTSEVFCQPCWINDSADIYNIQSRFYVEKANLKGNASYSAIHCKSDCKKILDTDFINFRDIYDFSVQQNNNEDSLLTIIGTKNYKKRTDIAQLKDSTVIWIYRIDLITKKPIDSTFITDLNYTSIDENGLIGVTDSTASGTRTYYLNADDNTTIDYIDGALLTGFYLYPSKQSDQKPYFILRNSSNSLFTIASLQQNQLHKLYDGFSSLSVQINHTVIGKAGESIKLYKPTALPDVTSRDYSEIKSFFQNINYTSAKERNSDNWWLISKNLDESEIGTPDSMGKINSLKIFPKGFSKKDYVLAEVIEKAETKWYYGEINVAGEIDFHEISNTQPFCLEPFFDGFILYQNKDSDLFIQNVDALTQNKQKLDNIKGVDLKTLKSFKLIDVTSTSGTYLIIGHQPDTSKSLAVVFQANKRTNKITVRSVDTISSKNYYVSENKFLYFKKPGSQFWCIRDLDKGGDLIREEKDSLVVVKPFIDLSAETSNPNKKLYRAKAIRLEKNNEEPEALIKPEKTNP